MEIEELGLEVKVYNRLKKAGINTTDELMTEMYKGSSDIKVSAPDAKRCEEALKAVGIIKYVRGDYVTEDDIEPEPLTWDELHNYIGKLVVYDCSTESHRWLGVIWLYDIKDDGEGTAICLDNSRNYSYIRRSTVDGGFKRDPEYLKKHEHLKNSGRIFALKNSEQEVGTVPETQVMSVDYTKAVTLTRRIKANAQAAQESLWEVCKGLKEMHDDKLYKELGYSSFESYTEEEVGLSRFMAYKYISIGDIKNVESIQQIGVTKLALLAKLDEPQREEVQQNVDVEAVSVRELKAEIEKLNDEKKGYKERQDKLLSRNKQLVSELEKSEASREKLDADLDEAIDAKKEALDTVKSLEHQIEELESKPHESYEDTTKIDELKKQLAEAERRHKAELESVRTAPAEDVKGVFKAHMIAAVDALKHLTQFTETHKTAPERNLFIEKLQDVDALINQTISILKGV